MRCFLAEILCLSFVCLVTLIMSDVVAAADEQSVVSLVAPTDKHPLYQDQLRNKYLLFFFLITRGNYSTKNQTEHKAKASSSY